MITRKVTSEPCVQSLENPRRLPCNMKYCKPARLIETNPNVTMVSSEQTIRSD